MSLPAISCFAPLVFPPFRTSFSYWDSIPLMLIQTADRSRHHTHDLNIIISACSLQPYGATSINSIVPQRTMSSTSMRILLAVVLPWWLSSHSVALLAPLSRPFYSSRSLPKPTSSLPPTHHDRSVGAAATTTSIHLSSSSSSQSANDNLGGFHYDTVPRGTSYISQVSKHDLSERRRMNRSSTSSSTASRRNSINTQQATTPKSQSMRTKLKISMAGRQGDMLMLTPSGRMTKQWLTIPSNERYSPIFNP